MKLPLIICKVLRSDFVWNLARKNPHRYMLLNPDGSNYMARRYLFKLGRYELRLHRIYSPDLGVWPHNHPFTFRGFVLGGSYNERKWEFEKSMPVHNWYQTGDATCMDRFSFHVITAISSVSNKQCYVPTVCLARWNDNRSAWGFLEEGEYVHYKQYQHNNPDD